MKNRPLRRLVAILLSLGVLSAPAQAIKYGCWACVAVTIPDPDGGPGWGDDLCLYDYGTALGCVDFFPGTPGGGCIEINEGDCD